MARATASARSVRKPRRWARSRSETKIAAVENLAAWLEETFPLSCPVDVRFSRSVPADEQACTWYFEDAGSRQLLILLRLGATLDAMLEALVHEWAHGLTLPKRRTSASPHDDVFWMAYGRIYRAYFEEPSAGLDVDRQGGREPGQRSST